MKHDDGLAYFTWSVAKDGYRWIDAAAVGEKTMGRYLSTGVPDGLHYAWRRYNPLQHSALFRDFVETPTTEEGIIRFANKWGPLGGTATVGVAVKSAPGSRTCELGDGEAKGTWVTEISQMRELVDLWDLVMKRDPRLRERVVWGENRVRYVGPPVAGLASNLRSSVEIAHADASPETFGRLVPGDSVGPATCYLQMVVNKKLMEYDVTARLLWDARHERLGIHLVPSSLIGCLWFQFARAIDGERKYSRCPVCRRWFEITSTVSRKDRVFCSPSCKAGNHRRKIAEAKRLHAGGATPKAIAHKLETTVKSVKGWLKP